MLLISKLVMKKKALLELNNFQFNFKSRRVVSSLSFIYVQNRHSAKTVTLNNREKKRELRIKSEVSIQLTKLLQINIYCY